MTENNVTTLPSRDPIFALVPNLKLWRTSRTPGLLVTTSTDVADYFNVPHTKVLCDIGHVIADISRWQRRLWFSDRGGFFALRSDPLPLLVTWESERALDFSAAWAKLVWATGREIEAKTGVNPILQGFKKFFPDIGMGYVINGKFHQCCCECDQPLPAGPVLHDELWATIAKHPDAYLCFDRIEKRLDRELTQADLKVCAFNAGWISFDGADVAALQFARGRRLLPEAKP